ncbi:hypothetical protein M2137_002367 [Parabacteroides sp. PFB2-10]|uniref:hypothetical protein n=1 Tax=Parabacteroides sp. PFB2-10 TaxID=1742405 RepID=UPI00247561DD|nr:hypothetical protein [Parabacteroides sp. PFB2-10]MDH6313577.1 hypothetical protein [Parabacteroides sp. PFB2-10]MDL2245298.1 hypothetical protein [Parabacteroides sp. OttesenSCG-928-J18]
MKTNLYIRKIWMAILALCALSCAQEEGIYKNNEKGKPENNPSARYSFIVSGGRSQTKGEMPDTRATLNLDTYEYWWDKGDQVVMSVTKVNEPVNIVSGFKNMELTAMNLEPALRTTFLTDLVQVQYQNLMDAGTHFDFYSFFPHNINGLASASFPSTLQFTMLSSYTIASNTFVPAKYAPMVAVVKNEEPEIFFPEGDVDPVYQLGGLHFDYEHILSYAAIEMDVRLMPDAVTSITMTVGSSTSDATRINGTMQYNPLDSTYTLSGGSNSVTVNISDGGLTAGDGSAVYIPMPVKDLSGQTLTFTFTTASSSNAYKTLYTTSGVNFERGKIHRIRLAPAAQYAAGTSFTVSKSGYYYIEAWGGDGGKGGKGERSSNTQRDGGKAIKASGLYKLEKDTPLFIYVGSAGASMASGDQGSGTGANGGTNNWSYGNGGKGGDASGGWVGLSGYNYAGAGGGGGAATFVLSSNALSGTLICSGGAAGSGGGSGNSTGTGSSGGMGGDGNADNGDNASNSGGAGATTASSDTNGSAGANGETGSGVAAWGGAGGGGGGGYLYGGNGGARGKAGGGSNSRGGGGGKGGQNYVATQAPNPGLTLPTNTTRPSSNGYVVITYFR